MARGAFSIGLWSLCQEHRDCDLRLARGALATAERVVLVPVCLLAELGAVDMDSCQLPSGRRAKGMEILPPPMRQRTDLPLLPSLRLKLPPDSCRLGRTRRQLFKHFIVF